MDGIVILHRPSSRTRESFGSGMLVWKTCLRQIAFVTPNEVASRAQAEIEGDEVFEGPAAYAFLLEVVCGLRSPVIGETEVFGQFKNFVAENAGFLSGFFQSVIHAAKELRSEHLIHLGSQGYGSLVRKLSKADSSVSILGSGQLAEEILPWLTKQKQVRLHCRNRDRRVQLKTQHPVVEAFPLDAAEPLAHTCVVVAAPLGDDELAHWLRQQSGQVRKILDLRAELSDASLFQEYQFISLKDVFGSIEKNRSSLQQKVLQLQAIIQSRAQDYCERTLLRPFGWEDLCV